MSHAADNPNRGGRPPLREIPPQVLLNRFVEYDRDTRRLRRHSISRAGFASFLNKPAATLRAHLTDYNFPWPPISPGELVLLLDDAPPHELLWICDAWCELCGRSWDDLMYKPATRLRELGVADGPREMHRAVARQLRERPSESGTVDGWIRNALDECLSAQFELRYGQRSEAFYVRATLVKLNDVHDAEVFNVEPGVILRRRTLDQVDLIDLERLWRENIPPYRFPSQPDE